MREFLRYAFARFPCLEPIAPDACDPGALGTLAQGCVNWVHDWAFAREVRLLRIFKLAKKMRSFRVLVKAMARTVVSMGHFTIVLILMMLVFTLMGMTFFATKFLFEIDPDGQKRVPPSPATQAILT